MTTNDLKELHNQYYTQAASLEWVLERMTLAGYCPALLFDDDGRWALTFAGTGPMTVGADVDHFITNFVAADQWHDSVMAAVLTAIENIIVFRSENEGVSDA